MKRAKLTIRRIILLVVIILVAGGIYYWRNQSVKSQQDKIETVTVREDSITETVTSTGKTKAKTTVDLKFQTTGRLAWINIAEGDLVTKNQAIAGLDTRELYKNLQKALRDYSKERNDFEEDRLDTYKYKALTDTIKRILEKNQWDLEKAVIDVELKNIALQLATLTSPIDGVVTHIDTPVAGVNLTVTDKITITDPGSLIFSANVDETDVGKISVGQTAAINLDAYPESTFSGVVSKVAFTAETSSSGATVFPVEISFLDQENLLSGLNGDMAIVVSQISDVLTLPVTAVRESKSGKYVIRKKGNNFERVSVETGSSADDTTEIKVGLTKRDEVVEKGFQYLPKELVNGG